MLLSCPLKVSLTDKHSLQMTYLTTPAMHKFPALKKILSSVQPTPQKTIFFVSTCTGVDYLCTVLQSVLGDDFTIIPLHGKHQANVRQKNFTRFTTAQTPAILLTTDVASRGLDIPAVDLVVQIDPPADPKTFIHRCGRAGRAGRRGLSVVLIHPGREEDYVSFLEVRKTPVTPFPHEIYVTDEEAEAATNMTRQLVLKDRAHHDRGQKAFVSWVRSYSKHQAGSIFRVADLDWEGLGKAWGLLKMPKMPELKKFTGDRSLGVKMDWDNYTYQDKQREVRRKEAIKQARENPESTQPDSNKRRASESVAWSNNVDSRNKKHKRRELKKTKQDKNRWDRMTDDEKAKVLETQRMLQEVKLNNEEIKRQKLESKTEGNAKGTAPDEGEDFEGFD